MAFRNICTTIRQSAERMRLRGLTLQRIASDLDVSITSVYKWTKFIPNERRHKNNNMLLNAKTGVRGRALNVSGINAKTLAKLIKCNLVRVVVK